MYKAPMGNREKGTGKEQTTLQTSAGGAALLEGHGSAGAGFMLSPNTRTKMAGATHHARAKINENSLVVDK
jgi:hypothetical protein